MTWSLVGHTLQSDRRFGVWVIHTSLPRYCHMVVTLGPGRGHACSVRQLSEGVNHPTNLKCWGLGARLAQLAECETLKMLGAYAP